MRLDYRTIFEELNKERVDYFLNLAPRFE
jgi:hypothetical protein